MTSKISFFNLQKENLRHRPGMIMLAFSYCVYHILMLIITIQNEFYANAADTVLGTQTKMELVKALRDLVSPNDMFIFPACLLAVVFAIAGFAYLHDRRKVDLYHSLPVKRRRIFRVIVTNSLLTFMTALALAQLVELVIIGMLGYLTPDMAAQALLTFLCMMLIFTAIFFLAALAMIMTGNLFVGILGTGVFMVWIPLAVKGVIVSLGTNFLDSWVQMPSYLHYLDYGSPMWLAMRIGTMSSEKWTLAEHGNVILALVLWSAALFFLNEKLFQKRPSEAAGKSMAFPKWNGLIGIILVIPLAVGTGVFFYGIALFTTKVWLVFGILLGTFVFHGIIQSIMQADLRSFLSRQKQMFTALALTFGIVAIFYFDVFGYDTWVPQADQVKDIQINAYALMDREKIFWGKEQEMSQAEKTEILSMLEETMQYLDEGKTSSDGISVTYKMKNGGEARRDYRIPEKKAKEIMNELFRSEEYKKRFYSLYTSNWDNIREICLDNLQMSAMSRQERDTFLQTYLRELDTLTYEEMRTKIPLGEIVLTHSEKNDEVNYREDYYFIYDDFKETIAFLEGKGYKVQNTFADIYVKNITVEKYNEGRMDSSWVVTDRAVIDAVKGRLYKDFSSYPVGYAGYESKTNQYTVTVNYRDQYGVRDETVITDMDVIRMLE